MNPFVLIPIALELMSLLPKLVKLRNDPDIAKLITIVQQFAAQLFPDAAPETPKDTIEHVKWIQTMLNKHGAKLDVDGVYGSNTKRAVEAFQRKYDQLDVDGYFGPKTEAVMRSL